MARLRAVRVLRRRAHASRAASGSSWPGFEIDVIFTPGPQPRPRHVLDPRRAGRLLRRRPVPGLGRPHRPARAATGRRCSSRSAALVDSLPGRDDGLPRPHGHHDARRRARDATRSWRSWPAEASRRRRAPSTCCRRTRRRGLSSSSRRRGAARARRLRLHRDADLRGHRAVRARRRRVHRHRPEGDVHLRGHGRPLADAAARGHRAGLPRLRRARHAQAPAAGEALVLGPVLPPRGAAGRAATASSRRSAPRRSARTTRRSTPR